MVAFGGAQEFAFEYGDKLGGTHGKNGSIKLTILLWFCVLVTSNRISKAAR
jgi:hypothetical protein